MCVVEDDAAVRNALKFFLEVEGLAVRTYDGAARLLDDSELPSCRCLVVDYRLPAMDGFARYRNRSCRHRDESL